MPAERIIIPVGGVAVNLGTQLLNAQPHYAERLVRQTAELGLTLTQQSLIPQSIVAIQEHLTSIPRDQEIPSILLHTALILARYDDLTRVYSQSDGNDQESLQQIRHAFELTRANISLGTAFEGAPIRRRAQLADQHSVVTNALAIFVARKWPQAKLPTLLAAINESTAQALMILDVENEASIPEQLARLTPGQIERKLVSLMRDGAGIQITKLAQFLGVDIFHIDSYDFHRIADQTDERQRRLVYELGQTIDNLSFIRLGRSLDLIDRQDLLLGGTVLPVLRQTIYTTLLAAIARQQESARLETLTETVTIVPHAIPSFEEILAMIDVSAIELFSDQTSASEGLAYLARRTVEHGYHIARVFLQDRDHEDDLGTDDGGRGPRRGGGGFGGGDNSPSSTGPAGEKLKMLEV